MNKRDRKVALQWAAKNELSRWEPFPAAIEGLAGWPTSDQDLALVAKWCHAQACTENLTPLPPPPTPTEVAQAHGYEYHQLDRATGPARQAEIMAGLYHPHSEWCSARGSAWSWPCIAIIKKPDAAKIKPASKPERGDEYGLSVMRIKAGAGAWSAVSRYNHAAPGDVDRTDFSWRRELIASMRHHAGIPAAEDNNLPSGIMSAGDRLFSVGEESAGVYPCTGVSGYIAAGKYEPLDDEAWVERGLIISLGVNPTVRTLPGAPLGILSTCEALVAQLDACRAQRLRVTATVTQGEGELRADGHPMPIMTWTQK